MKKKLDSIQVLLILLVFFSLLSVLLFPFRCASEAFVKNVQRRELHPIREKPNQMDYVAFPLLIGVAMLFRQASKQYRPVRQAAWFISAVVAAVAIMVYFQGVHWVVFVWLLGLLFLWHLFVPHPSLKGYYWHYPYRSGFIFLFFLNHFGRYRDALSTIAFGFVYLAIFAVLRYIIWKNEKKASFNLNAA